MSICRKCIHKWYYGIKGRKNRQVCTHLELPSGRAPSKTLKECRGFKEAKEEDLNRIRKRTRN